jgi:acetyl-CoA carboxylase biotin carboxyl carrier protein
MQEQNNKGKTHMAGKSSVIDQAVIRDLAAILKETDLTEIEVEQGELRIRVSRAGTIAAPAQVQHFTAPPAMAAAAPAPPAVSAAASVNAVPSPMVGTAYFAAAPGADPFVQIGSKVKEGQTILIIEAMKTMNQIASPRSGTVTAILIEDASPVEYGELLMVIE